MKVLRVDFQATDASKRFAESFRNTGFAVLSNHSIDRSLSANLYTAWKVFFDSDYKVTYPFDKERQIGYAPYRTENSVYTSKKNLYEFYNYYPGEIHPKEVSPFAPKLHRALTKLGETILTWLDEVTPTEITAQLSTPLASMVEASPNNLMRILHYPPLSGEKIAGEQRHSPHEDSNLLTLLCPPTAGGLEVQDNDGRWHEVEHDHNDLVINSGEQLRICTNNYYRATTHQVTNPEDSQGMSRMSCPVFMHPRDEVLLNDKGLTAGAFMDDYLRRNGVK